MKIELFLDEDVHSGLAHGAERGGHGAWRRKQGAESREVNGDDCISRIKRNN